MNSRTYQLSAQTNDFNKDDNKYFSHAVTKLLTAEQLLDAICTVTEVPEKFAGHAAGHAGGAAARRRGQPSVPEDVRPAGPRTGLRVRARGRQQPGPGAAAHQRPDRQREAAQPPTTASAGCSARRRRTATILSELYLATLSRLPAEGEVSRGAGARRKAKPETSARPGKTCSGRWSTRRSSCSGINGSSAAERAAAGDEPCGGFFRHRAPAATRLDRRAGRCP